MKIFYFNYWLLGKIWSRDRRLLSPAFHGKSVENSLTIMCEKADIFNDCIKNILEKNPKEPIAIYELTTKYTMSVLCEAVMGVSKNFLQKSKTPYWIALERYL